MQQRDATFAPQTVFENRSSFSGNSPSD